MEQIIIGRLSGDYRLVFNRAEVTAENSVVLELALDEVNENDLQLIFEYPANMSHRNTYYSEFMKLNERAPDGILRYEIPGAILRRIGKIYVQAVLGVTGSLKWSEMSDAASIVVRVSADCGEPENGMLASIRDTYERTNATLKELENKTAEDFGGVSNKGGIIAGELEVNGSLLINGDRAATAQELEALRAELDRESLDVDPYFESTAGSIVTVDGTPTGKYIEPEDYKVTLPLQQYVSPNLYDYTTVTLRNSNTNEFEKSNNGWTGAGAAGDPNTSFAGEVMLYNMAMKEGTYTLSFDATLLTEGSSGKNISVYAFQSEGSVVIGAKSLNLTTENGRYSATFALPADGNYSFVYRLRGNKIRVAKTILNEGSTAGNYASYTGTPSPINLIPVNSPSVVTVRSVSSNLLTESHPLINNQTTTLVDFGCDVTMNAIIGFQVKNFSIASAAGAVIDFRKEDGTHQYRTGPAFGWKTGETYTGVYTNKAENLTFRYVMFYGYDDGYSKMSGTIENVMMNFGKDILPYQSYESETVTLAPRDMSGFAVALSGGVAGAENTIEYKDGKPYYVSNTKAVTFNGTENFVLSSPTLDGSFSYVLNNLDPSFSNSAKNRDAVCNRFRQTSTEGYDGSGKMQYGEFKTQNHSAYFTSDQETAEEFKTWLSTHPTTVWLKSSVPLYTELNPASLPVLQTYSPQTTFFVTSDVADLYPSIDLTALSAQNATFSKGVLKTGKGEILTPLTTLDMIMTADGRTLESALESDFAKSAELAGKLNTADAAVTYLKKTDAAATYATKAEVSAKQDGAEANEIFLKKSDAERLYATQYEVTDARGSKITVNGEMRSTWNADAKLDVDATAARATADADGNAIATTYARKTEVGTKVTVGGAAQASWNADTKLNVSGGTVATLNVNGLLETKKLLVNSDTSVNPKFYHVHANYLRGTGLHHVTVKTKIKFLPGQAGMYTLSIRGYHYQDSKSFDFHLWFYNYDGGFYAPRYSNAGGACVPDDLKLYTYFVEETEYVAIDLDFTSYKELNYSGIEIDVSDHQNGLRNVLSGDWSSYASDGSETPAIGINHCVSVAQNQFYLKRNDTAVRAEGDAAGNTITSTYATKTEINELWKIIYPVGAIYISAAAASPATLLGGTWEQIQNVFLLAAGSAYAAGGTGGEAAHQLNVTELPSHDHNGDGGSYISGYDSGPQSSLTSQKIYGTSLRSSGGKTFFASGAGAPNRSMYSYSFQDTGAKVGGGSAHNNMPPYLAVYMWKRIS